MINLKINDYIKVVENCSKILDRNKKENTNPLDENNIKALFRRGCAYIKLYEFQKAQNDLTKAIKLDPKDKNLRIELENLKKEKKN